MIDLLSLNIQHHLFYFLVVMRVSGFFFTVPIISSANIPVLLRIFLSVFISFVIYNWIPIVKVDYTTLGTLAYFLYAIKELLIGIEVGFMLQFVFVALDFASNLIGIQMGFAIANIINPYSGIQTSLVAGFTNAIAVLLFFALNFHHAIFYILVESFELIPIGGAKLNQSLVSEILRYSADIFVFALKLGAPIIFITFFANVIMGFMVKTIPQMNIFIVGIPISIGLGLLFLFASMPFLVEVIEQYFTLSIKRMISILRLIQP